MGELQFGGEEEEKIRRAVATFCSNQPSALELIKSKKKKDPRFTLFMQVAAAAAAAGATRFAPRSARRLALSLWLCFQAAESNRLCRRLQLKDIIPVEMQRATKYPILLDKIAKYTGRRVRLISTLGGFDGAWAKLEGGRGNFYLTLRFFFFVRRG